MAKNTDQQVLDFIKEVTRQKEEISKAEKPNWSTNCSFSYIEGKTNDAINLHVESNVKNLICIAAFLKNMEKSYKETAVLLGVEAPPEFTWSGFSAADWLEDIKMRLNKIQIVSKRKKLEALEERLNKIVSPELRTKLELEAIAALLN